MGDTIAAKASESEIGTSGRPDQLDQQIGFLLRQAQQRHTAIFARMMLEEVTPTQWATLAKLHEIGGCSQNLLGRHVAMDAATIKGVVDRLRSKGLVTLNPDPNDRRRTTISAAGSGEELRATLHHMGRTITERTLAPLTRAERKTLLRLLSKLT